MQAELAEKDISVSGMLFLIEDSGIAIASSVKARGGIQEVLTHTEDLALEAGLLSEEDTKGRGILLPNAPSLMRRHAHSSPVTPYRSVPPGTSA